jgi:DDE superfamily endonuclease
MQLVASFARFVHTTARSMTAPSRTNLLTVLGGWLFAPRRTITSCLIAAGVAGKRHHGAFHGLFAAARWSLDRLGFSLFELSAAFRPKDGPAALTLDDTLAHKRGKKSFGAGMHHDNARSSRQAPVLSYGHSWVVLAVVVRLPCVPERVFSLPFLFRLYLNKRSARRLRRPYRTKAQLALDALAAVAARFPEQRFHVRADSAYGGHPMLRGLPPRVDLTSRLHLDARLNAPVGRRVGPKGGRPRVRGARLPSPRALLATGGHERELRLYGRRERARVATLVAFSYHLPTRPLRVVAVEPRSGGRRRQAFFSTRSEQTAAEVLTEYAERWSIEEANQASKSHLGFEQPQGWSRRAVERTAPMAMLLYGLVVLWFGHIGHRLYRPLKRPWYPHKRHPSFADMLTTLRRACLRAEVVRDRRSTKTSHNLLETLAIAA